MTDGHLTEEKLNDYAEGVLEPAVRGSVEAHLAACTECRAEAAGLSALLEDLGRLPREIRPRRELLPQIEARLRPRRASLAAAALALVTVGAAAAVLLVRGPDPAPVAERGPFGDGEGPPTAGPAGFPTVAAEYDRAIGELAGALESRRAELDPTTVRLVEENLAIIDRAIRESRAALAADPGDETLRQLVLFSYERKLDLLRQATQPAAPL